MILKDVRAWNRKHGIMWILYGVVITLGMMIGMIVGDSLMEDNHWFRYRAGAIIVEDGKVLFVTSKSFDYYYTVGGGVHIGEKAEECVLREVYEETGIPYEIFRLAAV